MSRLLVCIILFFFISCKDTQTRPDIILIGGKIWTAESDSTFNEALAITGNIISHIGTSEEIMKLAGEKTRVIDLAGKLVSPGFNDAHIHFLSGSIGLAQIELTGTTSIQDILNRVRDFADKNPGSKWITGRGWLYTQFASGMPTKEILDSVILDRPVFIRAYDGHSGWANSKALELAGVKKSTVFSGYGEIVRDKRGEPTGAFTERAQSLIAKLIPEFTRKEKLEALRKGMKLAASLGITSLQNASGSPDEVTLYEELFRKNELTVRIGAAFSIDADVTQQDIDSMIGIRKRIGTNQLLRTSAVKFMLDGVIESHTAAMLEPYADLSPKDPDSKGSLGWPLNRYRDLVAQFDKLGFQIFTHAIGDLAVRESLNAYENAAKVNGTKNARHRIEHIETISSEDFARFSQLGVMPSMEPIHADPATISIWENAIGAVRLPNSFAWASMLKNNAALVFSSDWPACISLNPIRGIHVAVNRMTPDGFPDKGWVPEQKISLGQAMLVYTRQGAYSSFEEDFKGKLLPGYLADMIVFYQNPYEMDPMELFKAKVEMTIFDGKIVYSGGE